MAASPVHLAAGTPGPDPAANLEQIHGWARDACRRGIRLLVTPELFVTAEADAGGAVLRERLRSIARGCGVGLVASTPEASGAATFIGADWWDAEGNHVAHTRKHRLTAWQGARGFAAWDGAPQPVLTSMYSEYGMESAVALAFADDAEDPAYAYFLRDHGVRAVLAVGPASSRLTAIAPSRGWAPKNTGVPFPQSGPLPEELLRPLPRVAAAWWALPARHPAADLGS